MSFLQNFEALRKSIPIPAVRAANNENCQLIDYVYSSKNCYHCFFCPDQLENGLYCFGSANSRELVDCTFCLLSELLYHCVECIKCYNSTYLEDCTNCRDCHFCSMCINCFNCFGCVALSHKQYCIFNKQYTKAEYEQKISKMKQTNFEENLKIFRNLIKTTPRPQSFQRKNDNCPYGDYLSNSKNVYWGFNTYWLEDSGYIFYGGLAKNCWDMSFSGGGSATKGGTTKGSTELCYEVSGAGGCFNCAFGDYISMCTNCYYCSTCINCSDCFGCVGLTNKKYCILNNQLTKNQYEEAVKQIKEELGWKK